MNANEQVTLNGLGRLLASENSATDLLSLLVDLDPSPVSQVFDLPDSESYVALREVPTQGRGRLDLVIEGAETKEIRAVLEMKGASSIHGDQLDRYVTWASELKPSRPRLFFCAFDKEEGDASDNWTRLRLRDVYAPWQRSAHPHAAWLADLIVETFDQWDAEANGQLGRSTGYYVNDVVTKRITRGLVPRLLDAVDPSNANASATRDNAGSPMIFAWAAHPRDSHDCSVSVGIDLRASPRRLGGKVWKFRPHIEVDMVDSNKRTLRTRREAQSLAFELASKIRLSMSSGSLREELTVRGLGHVAETLSGGKFDGFKKSAAAFDFEGWNQHIEQAKSYPGAGPFGSDKGMRLATILNLDVSTLTRHDIENLVAETVSILHTAAVQNLD